MERDKGKRGMLERKGNEMEQEIVWGGEGEGERMARKHGE